MALNILKLMEYNKKLEKKTNKLSCSADMLHLISVIKIPYYMAIHNCSPGLINSIGKCSVVSRSNV